MTWLKLSDDYADECARAGLSDAAFRTHTEALGWVMRRETGGLIDARDVLRFAETDDPDLAIAELLDAGFWTRTDTGYRLMHHMEHQPEPTVLEARRKSTAARVQRHRRKQAGIEAVDKPVDNPPDVTPLRDALPGSGPARTSGTSGTSNAVQGVTRYAELAEVVINALPDRLARGVTRSTLQQACSELGEDWTPALLAQQAQASDWDGVRGGGGVINWVRHTATKQPPPAPPPRSEPKSAEQCPDGYAYAVDGTCGCGKHDRARGDE